MAYNNENHFIKVDAKREQHFVILYYVTHGKEPVKICRKLCKGYGDNITSGVMVWKWVKKFLEGYTDVHDESRSVNVSLIYTFWELHWYVLLKFM